MEDGRFRYLVIAALYLVIRYSRTLGGPSSVSSGHECDGELARSIAGACTNSF